MTRSLFVAQCHKRVDVRRPPCWQIRCQLCGGHQQQDKAPRTVNGSMRVTPKSSDSTGRDAAHAAGSPTAMPASTRRTAPFSTAPRRAVASSRAPFGCRFP